MVRRPLAGRMAAPETAARAAGAYERGVAQGRRARDLPDAQARQWQDRFALHMGGFGTPFFGNDVQIRVAGDALIVQVGERIQHGRLTTLEDAAEFIGFDLTRYDLAGADEPLEIDADASCWLGEWYGFAASVLQQLRAESPKELEVSRVQLWPEHFDLAVELGSEQEGRRATYGMSPGDEQHEGPYIYVSPWEGVPDDAELWNARGFRGAELSFDELLQASDQRERALAFLRERRDALAGSRGAR